MDRCGRSSVVEHNLAKVGVDGSNPFARSIFFLLFIFHSIFYHLSPRVCTLLFKDDNIIRTFGYEGFTDMYRAVTIGTA